MAAEPQQADWEGREETAPGLAAEHTRELRAIADATGLPVAWVRGDRPAGVWAAGANSLCQFFQNRAESAPLCARDCGALTAPTAEVHATRCHAGLYVVRAALPPQGGEAQALVGGRAWVTRADYQALAERFRQGDLSRDFRPEIFSNLLWATPGRVAELGRQLADWAVVQRETQGETAPAMLVEPLTVLSDEGVAPVAVVPLQPAESLVSPPELLWEAGANPFYEACEAAVRALAGACDLRRAALLWPEGGRFGWAYRIGGWAMETSRIDCYPHDTRLFLAAEAKSSLVLVEKESAWQPLEEVPDAPADAPQAELFPFLAGMEIKAALLVASDDLDDSKRRAVATFGQALALPLEVLRLRQESAQRARWTGYATQLARQLNAPGQTDDFEPIVAHSARLCRARRASLMVYEEAEGELAIRAGIGLPAEVRENVRLRLGEGVAGRALSEGRALLAHDVVTAGRSYDTETFISYPLFIGGRPGGVLNLTERTGGTFDEADVQLLDFLAPQLALALDRAEWHEKALQFRYMSITDPLTGLANRRYLMARLAEEVSRASRRHEPLSFMMLDLDDFKCYNDQNGHQAGDEALVLLARCLHSNLRGADVAARYGGEEFSILLPQTTLQEARTIGERIQWQVAETVFPHGHRQPGGAVTISIGVADYAPGRATPDDIIKAADQALYQAKSMGKDLVQVYKD